MKINTVPGIFNDVLGPVMRGPSSSHTAGSHRIGNVIRQLAGADITKVIFQFHPEGSLASTYQSQGSDIGLAAGLMGIEMTHPDVPDSLKIAGESGLDICFNIIDYPADHPNTYKCLIEKKDGNDFKARAISIGGGIVKFTELQGLECDLQMDLPSLVIYGKSSIVNNWWGTAQKDINFSKQVFTQELKFKDDLALLTVEFKVPKPLIPEIELQNCFIKLIQPVYPSMGYAGGLIPFRTAEDLEKRKDISELDLADLAIEYETKRSGISHEEVFSRMEKIVDILLESIDKGLTGTKYNDRIAPAQSPRFVELMQKGKLIPAGPLQKMTAYTMAIMEAKSAMEVIVAAPTAGSAGGAPGALIALSEEMGLTRKDLTRAFLAAGIVGVFISADATFAAEVAGCQAETGAGASMAAAGMIQLAGGNAKQGMDAASIAMQNILGLVCDPVGNRVEIPCLSRNVQAGSNALISANMILGGVDAFIPLSESIKTMLEVGKALPRELRCTALGGLSITKTAKELEKRLKNQ